MRKTEMAFAGLLAVFLPLPAMAQTHEPLAWPPEADWKTGSDSLERPQYSLESNTIKMADAKKVFVLSDLPVSHATPPEWFTKFYIAVDNPDDADMDVFVRAGAGGNDDPDLLVMKKDEVLFRSTAPKSPEAKPPQPPPQPETYNPCHQWPYSNQLSCALANLNEQVQQSRDEKAKQQTEQLKQQAEQNAQWEANKRENEIGHTNWGALKLTLDEARNSKPTGNNN